jgi:hypothetical protein
MRKNSRWGANIWSIGSWACIVIGLICWIFDFAITGFKLDSDKYFPIGIVTFIIGPIGMACSFVSLKKGYPYSFSLLLGNLLMIFSPLFVGILAITLFFLSR